MELGSMNFSILLFNVVLIPAVLGNKRHVASSAHARSSANFQSKF
jgi:hypothetical protein